MENVIQSRFIEREENLETANQTDETENLRRARRAVEHHFCLLMSRSPADGLHWKSTASDLIEVTHMVWEARFMLDEQARPLTFKYMVRRIFAILHVPEPGNPYVVMNNIKHRKNALGLPITVRMQLLVTRQGRDNPSSLSWTDGATDCRLLPVGRGEARRLSAIFAIDLHFADF